MPIRSSIPPVLIFCLFAAAPLSAAPPLAFDKGAVRARAEAEVVLRAKVISHEREWSSRGEIIEKETLSRVSKAFRESKRPTVYHDDGTASVANLTEQWKKFVASKEGKIYWDLKCRVIVTLKPLETLKGKLKYPQRSFSCAWHTELMDTCPHVGTSTKVGTEVAVFLKKHWQSQVVLNPSYFLIGPVKLLAQEPEDK